MLTEDALAYFIARVWHWFPHLDDDRLHALETDLRAEFGGRTSYIAKGRNTSKRQAYLDARQRGIGVAEAATAAHMSIRHARRLEKNRAMPD